MYNWGLWQMSSHHTQSCHHITTLSSESTGQTSISVVSRLMMPASKHTPACLQFLLHLLMADDELI